MKLKVLTFLIIFSLLIGLTACQMPSSAGANGATNDGQAHAVAPAELYHASAFYLYTEVDISSYGQLPEAVYREIWDNLSAIDHKLSMNDAQSEIAQVNAAAGQRPVAVSADTYQLIKTALTYSAISDSFDISIGGLVQLWGIGSERAHLPEQTEIDAALQTIDYRNIQLDDAAQTVYLTEQHMAIDLGAIAKGYAADQTKQILRKHGVDKAIINFGGNILTIGSKADDGAWRIGIQNPTAPRGAYLGVLAITDQSVVTSGTYERFFESDGQRYHHILSTATGYPVDNALNAVSIIADSSTQCDALSTLIFAEGLAKGRQMIAEMDGVEAIFITKDNAVYLSDGIVDSFALKDTNYKIIEP